MTTATAPLLKALVPPERLDLAEWAERHVRLSPTVSNFPGPFRARMTPYVNGVFEAFRDPAIETIYLCFGSQTAKTTAMMICLLYTIDQDPGPALWTMPTETLARGFSEDRLQPLIDESPRLSAEKPIDRDDYKILHMRMRRMTLTLVGGNSPANLSSRPIRYLFGDEIDKFPIETTREGSALNLGIRRTVSFWNRKLLLASTPTLADGQVWTGLLSGDWRQFHVPCPKCGELQILAFANIRKPDGLRDLDRIRDESWYECAFCAHKIVDADKPAMLAAGQWRPRSDPDSQYEWIPPEPGGRIASFHLPSWYSPWRGFGDVLADFTDALAYPERLRVIINSDHGEPWEERGEAKSEADILDHCSEYNDGTLPADAAPLAIVQTIDVQKDHLYYTVRAWGAMEESWLVAYGLLPNFEAVTETLMRQYRGFDVKLCAFDAKYRTDEVFDYCRTHPRCLPVRGSYGLKNPITWSTVDRYPGGKAIPKGLKVMSFDGDYFRELFFHRLGVRRGDPGYWHLHATTATDYARQIIAEILIERKDTHGRLHKEWKQVRRDNHYLDCETIQLALANALGVRYHKSPKRRAPPPPAAKKKGADAWKPKRMRP